MVYGYETNISKKDLNPRYMDTIQREDRRVLSRWAETSDILSYAIFQDLIQTSRKSKIDKETVREGQDEGINQGDRCCYRPVGPWYILSSFEQLWAALK